MRRIAALAVLAAAIGGCSQGLEVFALRPPSRISAQAQPGGQLRVDWDPVPGAKSYRVYVAPASGVTSENFLSLGGTMQPASDPPMELSSLEPGVLHSLVVTAVAGGRESGDSPRVHGVPQIIPVLLETPDQILSEDTDSDATFGTALAAGDVNCDGRDDLLVGAPESNASGNGDTHLFLGRGVAVSTVVDRIHTGGNGFGSSVALGDVTGDGCAEMLVGTPLVNSGTGEALLYNGGHTNIGNELWSPAGNAAGDRFGDRVAFVGDVDGDALGDFVVAAPSQSENEQIALFAGASGNPSELPLDYLGIGGGGPTSLIPVALGDVTGDGRDDFFVGVPGYDFGGGSEHGLAYVQSYVQDTFVPVWSDGGTLAENEYYGASMAAADVNGDGFDDLVIGSPGSGDGSGAFDIFPWVESSGGFANESGGRFTANSTGGQLAFALAAAGDLDGDGFEDFFASSPTWKTAQTAEPLGRVRLYAGRFFPLAAPQWAVDGPEANARFGDAIATGDFDGDGHLDLAIGAPRRTTAIGVDGGEVAIFLTKIGSSPLPDAGASLRGAVGEILQPDGAWFTERARNRQWRCTWDAGDGTPPTVIDRCTPETAGDYHHVWSIAGEYELRLRVERMTDGLIGESATTVVIE